MWRLESLWSVLPNHHVGLFRMRPLTVSPVALQEWLDSIPVLSRVSCLCPCQPTMCYRILRIYREQSSPVFKEFIGNPVVYSMHLILAPEHYTDLC